MAEKNNAKLYDFSTFYQAGIDPKTGLPIKMDLLPTVLKDNIKKQLRILDEQNAINRYTWYNLPNGLNGQLIERILYYKGQAAFFYMESDGNFYFLPYALDGTIDVYGRFKGITPVQFNGTASDSKGNPWIKGLTKKPVYDVNEEIDYDTFVDGCVLLHDYSNQISQTNISRQVLQDPLLDAMAEAFPMARTALIANSGVKGMRVNDENQYSNVKAASRSITNAALCGDPWIPIVGNVEFQDLTNGTPLKAEEFLLYMQGLDNFRLSLYGLKNGGLFQKKAHMLEAEQEMNNGTTGLVYQDGLTIRQRFCDIVNAIWGLGIWCEASESVIGIDRNNDMMIGDNQDQSGLPGEQPETGGDSNE